MRKQRFRPNPFGGGGGINSIEFFISDNASTDGTQKYMQELSAKYPFVEYYRNDENIGADNNFIKCLNRANGKYTLLLGDDDELLPGAISAILSGIKLEPVFALLNFNNSYRNTQKITVFDDRNRFIMAAKSISLISVMLYRTDFVKKAQLKKSYYEINYMAIAYETLKHDGIYMLINHPCIQAVASISHYDPYRLLSNCFDLTSDYIKDDVDFDALKYISHRFLMNVSPFIYSYQRKNFKNQDESSKQDLLYKMSQMYPDLYPIFKYIFTCPLPELDDTEKIKIMLQKRRMEYLKEYCLKYEKIHIYGAGKCGEHIFKELTEIYGVKNIVGIVVSDGHEKNNVFDMPTLYASELSKLNENFGIIVAMRALFQIDVFFTLKSVGLLNQTYFCDWL